MTQRDAFDDLADRFGDDLDRAAAQRPARAVRKRRVALAGGSLAIAGTIAALVVGIGGESLDVVGEARAAIAPGAYILHTRTSSPAVGLGGPRNVASTIDQWTTTSPIRWRIAQTTNPAPNAPGIIRGHSSMEGSWQNAYAHGTQSTYSSRTNHLDLITGYDDRGVMSRIPNRFGLHDGDPMVALRTMLARGDVYDAGERTVDGHRVRELRGTIPATKNTPAWPMVADVDAATFVPVRLRYTQIYNPPPGVRTPKGGLRYFVDHLKIDVHFSLYEHLPLTQQNEKLLEIQTRPGVSVTTRSHAAIMAQMKATWRCHRMSSGANACRKVR